MNKKMNKKTSLIIRRITYITFIVIFLVATPLIILYTQGYRYNFKRGKIQKTGIIVVSSIPRGATISLNDKIVEDKKTPTRLEQILPADYVIKLEKPGYHQWQKQLNVGENSTTFAEKIILWKDSQPATTTLTGNFWQSSRDNQLVATWDQSKQSVEIFNTTLEKMLSEVNIASEVTPTFGWSADSGRLLIETSAALTILEVSNPQKKIAIPKNRLPEKITAVHWDNRNSNSLYVSNTAGLWLVNLGDQTYRRVMTADELTDFSADNDGAYWFDGRTIYYQKFSAAKPELIYNLNCLECRFVAEKTASLIMFNQAQEKVIIIDPTSKNKPVEIIAKNWQWLNDDNLLFHNDWELFTFSFVTNKLELITRFGEPIKQAVWHPWGRNIIISQGNKIKAIELDNRDLRNIIDLADTTDNKNLLINESGRDIYYNHGEEILKLNLGDFRAYQNLNIY